MTATLRERARPSGRRLSPSSDAGRGGQMSTRPGSDKLELLATLGLTVVTLVVTPGARGIMGHTVSLFGVIAVGLAMHLVPWGTRRLRIAAGPLITLVVYGLVVVWTALPHTTFLGIPTLETLHAAARGLRLGVRALDTRLNPGLVEESEVVQGRLLLGVASVGACAFMADQAAFRIRNAFLALIPSLSILLVGATRAPAANRGLMLAAYLAASLAFLLAHHTMATRSSAAVVQGRQGGWGMRLLPGGAALGALAIVVALVAGPHLPGYGRPALVDIESPTGTPTPSPDAGGLEVSPLVDLAPNLVQQADTLMFTVASDQPAYWRLTSLDRFDGRVWSQGQAANTGSARRGPGGFAFSGRLVTQDFEIAALRGRWLPAAYRARNVSEGPARLEPFDPYPVGPEGDLRSGLRYRLDSMLPQATPSVLGRARGSAADFTTTPYLELPTTLSPRVVAEARRVISASGAGGPYESALALQAYFRDNFTYDLKVRPGHGEDALVRFLFRTRRGYCEQFAAAYAVMARAVGLPARVAVGFTPGELGADGRYQVRGLNAHSWPEVYLENVGWMAFEPTPGRGMPGAEGYTGVPPQQEHFTPTPPVTVAGTTPVPTIAPTDSTVTTALGDTSNSSVVPTSDPLTTPTTVMASGSSSGAVRLGFLVAAMAAVGVLMAAPSVRALRRRRRRSGLVGPNDMVVLAWADAEREMAASGLGRAPAETMLAHARRAAGDDRLPADLAEPVLVLAGRAGSAAYSPQEMDPAVAEEAGREAAVIRSGLRQATPLPRRLIRNLFG